MEMYVLIPFGMYGDWKIELLIGGAFQFKGEYIVGSATGVSVALSFKILLDLLFKDFLLFPHLSLSLSLLKAVFFFFPLF